jgi:hypothetical protein
MRTTKANVGKLTSHRRTINARPSSHNGGDGARSTAPVQIKPAPPEISQTAIAQEAYFLWQKRGGDAMTNWLEAEAKLKGR